MTKIAEVDRRYQSYNIEMVQVTGGRFWAPYGGPAGETHRYLPPVDLASPRLRALASHLAPAYLRVSGTWANSTYVALEGEVVATPPPGFGQVLTGSQWRGVIDFAKAADAPIVTSFTASAGARDRNGQWTSTQADRLLRLTQAVGGRLHAAEFINEPSLVVPGGLPRDYGSAAYARDFAVFAKWANKRAPDMLLLGPGNLGEETVDPGIAAKLMAPGGAMKSELLLAATGPRLDAVSWHFYGAVSPRCGGGNGLSSRDAALTPEWLDRTLIEADAMTVLRDRLAPGKPLWLTETAQAACGGSPWAAGFRDTFRYLNQLGALAQRGVKVVIHNTLAASEYGLADPATLEPRPNYWGAVLWRRIMGPVVLASPAGVQGKLRSFAHCAPAMNGGVGLLLINAGESEQVFRAGAAGERWIMTAANLDTGQVSVNGVPPALSPDGSITGLGAARFVDEIAVPARSVVFASVAANNPHCRRR
ncbi:hypothetical protein M9978_05655 [Sphingomonas sp. MG17]|uniref:Glycosyl hydrolase family 79, N-terminal domain n=1 Tax=Sphingomonas tagetis TaxID=2949092 RepID=A0A9X2KNQ7_9SPHN|nr:hypothetical protein [Sphingomonas tagetis]MCP3729913.1 hypothetical protein [Sphingomonas tagetis]